MSRSVVRCVIEGCFGSDDAKPGTHRRVNWALFSMPRENLCAPGKPRAVQKSRKDKDCFSMTKDWFWHSSMWISIVIGILRFGISEGLP